MFYQAASQQTIQLNIIVYRMFLLKLQHTLLVIQLLNKETSHTILKLPISGLIEVAVVVFTNRKFKKISQN